ncbi:MAG TPA: TolC family protein, partial [Myxococcota bacterium]|nr:TolC family protein [Myxococcota bacterium]
MCRTGSAVSLRRVRIHPSPRLLPLVLVVLGLLAPGPRALRAETEGPVDAHVTTPTLGPPHDHPPVEADPDLTLAETIRLALERDPGLVGVEARQVEGRALERASRRWLAGAPALYGGAVSDSPVGSDIGYRQWDAGLELPLWWPGQRSPRRDVARAAKDAAAHAVRVQALEVAGQVRAAVAGLALARRRLELARGDREAEARLAERVERAVELGELAGREALLARTSVLERELAELEALEELRHAEASWVVLTGIERSPGEWGETLRSDARLEDHPALLLARDGEDQAEANAARLERSGWGQPTI